MPIKTPVSQEYVATTDLQKIISRYMIRSGFSIGIKDLIIHEDIRERNESHIMDAKRDIIDMTKQVHLNIFENVSMLLYIWTWVHGENKI